MERLGTERAEGFLEPHKSEVELGPPPACRLLWREGLPPGGVGARPSRAGSPSEQRTLLLPCQSVPEVDPAATMPRSQSQQRTNTSSYSSPPPAPYSAPQAPALSVTGPITANSEQVLADFWAVGKAADRPRSPFWDMCGGLP